MKLCSICGKKNERNFQSYCGKCHAEYIAIFRKLPPASKDKKRRLTSDKVRFLKDAVRKFTTKFINFGLIIKKPCEICNEKEVEAHHPNYLHPFEIKWLCQQHHMELHKNEKDTNDFGISEEFFE